MINHEFVKEIAALTRKGEPINQFEIEGRKYTDKVLQPLQAPLPETVKLSTLTGLVDFIEEAKGLPPIANYPRPTDADPEYYIHIVDHETVELVSVATDIWGRRFVGARAELTETLGFSFGNFIGQEAFIIAMLSQFIATPGRDELVRFVSKVAAQQQVENSDNGLTQEVSMKAGVVLVSHEKASTPGRVTLKPYRTFRDVDQPESEFVLRLRADQSGRPTMALFEADGGKWKLDAIDIIKRWLARNMDPKEMKPFTVVA